MFSYGLLRMDTPVSADPKRLGVIHVRDDSKRESGNSVLSVWHNDVDDDILWLVQSHFQVSK